MPGDGQTPATPDVEFVLVVEAGILEQQARLLCESLRAHTGRYRDAPIVAMAPRKERRPSQDFIAFAECNEIAYCDRTLEIECPEYGTSHRVFAAADRAERSDAAVLVILDSDTLFLREPDFALDGADVAVRPVDVKGRCTIGAGDPFDPYWRRLCSLGGLTYERLPFVTPTVDDRPVRASYNGGLVVVRRETGILQAAADLFGRSVRAGMSPHAVGESNVFASTGYVGDVASAYWGSSQAALAIAIWSATDRVRLLDPTYNVPLHVWDAWRARHPSVPLEDLVHVHYHWLCTPGYEAANPMLDGRLPFAPELGAWIRSRVPFCLEAAERVAPVSPTRTRSAAVERAPDPPRVSLVFAVHDPDYGGGLLARTQRHLDALVALANRERLSTEIVIVEWNPRPDRAPFRESLRWPDDLGCVRLRFLEVPDRVHRALPNADRIPIFEYFAKNAGLRRARGRFLLATNPDLLFSPALVRWLARARVSSERFYRVDRRDLSGDLAPGLTLAEQLRFCSAHVSRVHAYFGSYAPRHPGLVARLRARDPGRSLRREYERHRRNRPPRTPPTDDSRARLLLPADGLHRNAAGDFFLMHRDRWFELRGHPELHTHAHIDAILCWAAASAGIAQEILPDRCRLFHQSHDRASHAGFPQTDWAPWYERFVAARRSGSALVVNDRSWGLADETLRAWDACPELIEVACPPATAGTA